MMHAGLVEVITSIMKDVGIPNIAVVIDARGLRATDASRPGDVNVLDFFAEGRHLVIDAVVTTVYRNAILREAASVPGYATKQVENRKFYANRTSAQPISAIHGGPYIMVPFAMEDGAHLGAHALALLRALAIVALEKGRRPLFAHRAAGPSSPTLVSLWVHRWQQRLSSWLHLAISKHVTRLLCPMTADRLRYI